MAISRGVESMRAHRPDRIQQALAHCPPGGGRLRPILVECETTRCYFIRDLAVRHTSARFARAVPSPPDARSVARSLARRAFSSSPPRRPTPPGSMSSSPSRTHAGSDSPSTPSRARCWRTSSAASPGATPRGERVPGLERHHRRRARPGADVDRRLRRARRRAPPPRGGARDVAGIVRRFGRRAPRRVRLLRLRRRRSGAARSARREEGRAVDAEFIGAQFAERLPASCAIVGGVARGVIGSDTASAGAS